MVLPPKKLEAGDGFTKKERKWLNQLRDYAIATAAKAGMGTTTSESKDGTAVNVAPA